MTAAWIKGFPSYPDEPHEIYEARIRPVFERELARRDFRVMPDDMLAQVADRFNPHYDTREGYQNFLRACTEVKRRQAVA